MKTTQISRKEPKGSAKNGSTKKPAPGKELIYKAHEHKYNTPVAGEDGSTEDQSGGKNRKTGKTTEKSKSPTPGKSSGEKSKF